MGLELELELLGAAEAARMIRDGRISSEALVSACLARIEKREGQIEAWTFIDPGMALTQARAADTALQTGIQAGPLHGVPVGIKDIIDTRDMPTENGTILHRGRQPRNDATVVAKLREAGAVIMGKTVTTELAVYSPGKTRNPHDVSRTPGGSSSGSAAAVAAGMIPAAIGTQTNGSVIRPASFCGIYGYKPTFGMVSRYGVLQQSRQLDQIGVYGRNIEDVALLADVIIGYDDRDPESTMQANPELFLAQEHPPAKKPSLAFVKSPVWEQAEECMKTAFTELVSGLGLYVEACEPHETVNDVHDLHWLLMEADLARSFEREYAEGKDQLSAMLCEMIERGQNVSAADYKRAVSERDSCHQVFDEIFTEHDAIITPAAPGEAPLGLGSTGSPIFCTIWTYFGMPAVTLPLLQGENGMPIGVQLVGPRGGDAGLLRTARQLVDSMTSQ